MGDRVFVDTNVVVSLFDGDAPGKQAIARDVLQRDPEGLVLSTQVLQEFYVSVTRKLAEPLSEADAEAAVRDLGAFAVVIPTVATVLTAIARSRESHLAFRDALIVESAREAGCERLLTEDLPAGQRFGDLVIENPFATGR